MKRWIYPAGAVIVALLIGCAALTARAKEPRLDGADVVAAGTIGSIDMEEVYNASGAPQELDQAARQHETEGAERINKIMAVPYLESEELQEYGTLIGKTKMTPDEEKRAAALKTASDQCADEVRTLQAKQDITPVEKTRHAHLVNLRQTLETQVRPGLIADFRTQHEGWIAEFRHRQLAKLRQDVAKVAKDRHISHVFDSGTLVYSVNDLTPFVLQRLGKRDKSRGSE